MRIAKVAFIVRDYDEAIDWFVKKLGFELLEDVKLSETKRWVVIAPEGGIGAALLLAKAADASQAAVIGDQSGGRVMFFLETEDFYRAYSAMTANGVRFLQSPRHEVYGKVVVFEDLYGNRWDLIEPC